MGVVRFYPFAVKEWNLLIFQLNCCRVFWDSGLYILEKCIALESRRQGNNLKAFYHLGIKLSSGTTKFHFKSKHNVSFLFTDSNCKTIWAMRRRKPIDGFLLCGIFFWTIIGHFMSTCLAVNLEDRMEIVKRILKEVPLIDG